MYLTFSDLLIDSEILTYKEFINEHIIIRYVDDIFIVVSFCNEATQLQREKIIYSLTSQISDLLYSHLKLKLNKKTKLYWLGNKHDKEAILKDLKKVSPEYHLNDEENDETPENKLANIFHELQKLKNSSIDFSIYSDGTIEADILREIYEKSVNQLLSKEENIIQIEATFNEFNFDLVNVMPREIILIISKSKKVLQEFVNFLDSKIKLSTRDAYLILTLLCQHEFQYTHLFSRIKTIDSFKHIFNAFEEIFIFSEKPGYFQLSYEEVVLITQYSNVIEQIRLRIFNEKIYSYSVGLNHLLNEIHAVCMCFDTIKQKTKYEADDVVDFLTSKAIPHEICISIRNLFDRRNRNTVSHPSISDKIAWGVTKEEYVEYREVVGKCLKLILSFP
ncbi:hypothetical protein DSM106972_030310 [Dulcicalothrix desertica PCC 7102]|uniref:Uncharacterized protein n=1 Tax=Dulcicalothrix desertica PCC 7102 TaxID=232991 RepID=A0A433VKZ1_9CYAN|nr:hypothetical protein DSM106972_030310 [Dulcicalothrix desertica PCC 7102]TWH50117.1 AbiA family abortive infection protein [Dulcicalothrix desertica PCC 7102]